MTEQIHDYNGGIRPNHLFWTLLIASDAVDVDVGAGRARMAVTGLLAQDQATRVNAFTRYPGQRFPGYGAPAYLDYRVDWFDVVDRYRLRKQKLDFSGRFVQTHARVAWSAVQNATIVTDAHGAFASYGTDPVRFDGHSSRETVFAVLGRERNGRFFHR
ncbi:MAG: hypothetical protein ACRDMV_20100 [Streptosporangiales bacterium]